MQQTYVFKELFCSTVVVDNNSIRLNCQILSKHGGKETVILSCQLPELLFTYLEKYRFKTIQKFMRKTAVYFRAFLLPKTALVVSVSNTGKSFDFGDDKVSLSTEPVNFLSTTTQQGKCICF